MILVHILKSFSKLILGFNLCFCWCLLNFILIVSSEHLESITPFINWDDYFLVELSGWLEKLFEDPMSMCVFKKPKWNCISFLIYPLWNLKIKVQKIIQDCQVILIIIWGGLCNISYLKGCKYNILKFIFLIFLLFL